MNSYNHYAFGSVIAWVYRYAAGIDTTPDSPGFKEIIVHPHLDSRMSAARAEYESIYGKIISEWKGNSDGSVSFEGDDPRKHFSQGLLASDCRSPSLRRWELSERTSGRWIVRNSSGFGFVQL